MRSFLPLAFRRPVSEELQHYYVKMVHAALDRKLSFTEAMISGYKAALCSPHFLFLAEPIDAVPRRAAHRAWTITPSPRGCRISCGRRCRMTSCSRWRPRAS